VTGGLMVCSATNVPAPTLALTSPSADSRSYARVTVERATPSRFARSRLAGSASPGLSRPAMIARRICWWISRLTPFRPTRLM
jgi:hypothetical protein